MKVTRDELVETIDFLLFDPNVRRRMDEISRRIQQDNGWEKVAKQLSPFLTKTAD